MEELFEDIFAAIQVAIAKIIVVAVTIARMMIHHLIDLNLIDFLHLVDPIVHHYYSSFNSFIYNILKNSKKHY
jgi:hypothetical protein